MEEKTEKMETVLTENLDEQVPLPLRLPGYLLCALNAAFLLVP